MPRTPPWRVRILGRAPYANGPHCCIRRVESTPDPDIFEKYCDTPPISIAILLQKYALPLAESSKNTTNLYRDTPPICIAILLQKYQGHGVVGTPPIRKPEKPLRFISGEASEGSFPATVVPKMATPEILFFPN